jgi:hypothetical protein
LGIALSCVMQAAVYEISVASYWSKANEDLVNGPLSVNRSRYAAKSA